MSNTEKKATNRTACSTRWNQATLMLGFAGVMFSCATQKSGVLYSEDLTPNRPVFSTTELALKKPAKDTVIRKMTPSQNVNAKVDLVLDSIDQINLTKKYIDGFTIQIYSGQNKEDAMNVKQKMVAEVGDLPSSLQYIQPKFRVTAGSYITRLEAQKDLVRLKRHFTTAILVPEKIMLK